MARKFFIRIVGQARALGLTSDEDFTVDGTLIEALGLRLRVSSPRDLGTTNTRRPDDPGNPTVNLHAERRSNAAHQSTDPEAHLAREGAGKEAKLCYSGNALMENRNWIAAGL